jgi:hypothetical protein
MEGTSVLTYRLQSLGTHCALSEGVAEKNLWLWDGDRLVNNIKIQLDGKEGGGCRLQL